MCIENFVNIPICQLHSDFAYSCHSTRLPLSYLDYQSGDKRSSLREGDRLGIPLPST